MKVYRWIYLALVLTVFIAVLDCIQAGYAAHVTRKMITLLEVKGEDAFKLEVMFDKHIGDAVSAFVIVICQATIFFCFRRFKTCHRSNQMDEGATLA